MSFINGSDKERAEQVPAGEKGAKRAPKRSFKWANNPGLVLAAIRHTNKRDGVVPGEEYPGHADDYLSSVVRTLNTRREQMLLGNDAEREIAYAEGKGANLDVNGLRGILNGFVKRYKSNFKAVLPTFRRGREAAPLLDESELLEMADDFENMFEGLEVDDE